MRVPIVSLNYYHGRISRETAQNLLRSQGNTNGLFLLRDSVDTPGDFVISLCYNNKYHHYKINRSSDGTYGIEGGSRFSSPQDLVIHYSSLQSGFMTKLEKACYRNPGVGPMAFYGVTILDLDKLIIDEAERRLGSNMLNNRLDIAEGGERAELMRHVVATLHLQQPWYHHNIDRAESEKRVVEDGLQEGKFLVRFSRHADPHYTLVLSCNRTIHHYRISILAKEKYAIEDGPEFSNLMDLIDYYHNKADGLLCHLQQHVTNPNYTQPPENTIESVYFTRSLIASSDSTQLEQAATTNGDSVPYELEDHSSDYSIMPFLLEDSYLTLGSELGSGQFGNVRIGYYRTDGASKSIPVAVKTLKNSNGLVADVDYSDNGDFMREARLMSQFQHEFIIRMIGICRSESLMLVLELARLGPLNKYLRKNTKSISMSVIIHWLIQIGKGMAYLEENQFVHRDIAARNILLTDERTAKLSDFGLSRALEIGEAYYKASEAGNWPLKWYAPESIFYWTFDSKSDVWGFGVLMWEATNYCISKPYTGMRVGLILEKIEKEAYRLEKPAHCPEAVYEIMLRCWQLEPQKRPTFTSLCEDLQKHLLNERH